MLLQYFKKGTVGLLSSFGHEQYTSNSVYTKINQPMVFNYIIPY